MARSFTPPEALLKELGISEPNEIDIEAIAQYCGATIVYEVLEGCAARVVGHGDRAIITVDCRAQRPRQRFSAGHELGHWMLDRGKVGFACAESVLNSEWTADNAERRANEYAADCLLPEFMFVPRARNKEITFDTVDALAHQFVTSMTAAAIRLVQHGSFPAMIICSEGGRRKWFIRGPDVPEVLWPRERPEDDTLASSLTHGELSVKRPVEVYADSWIDHRDANRYSLVEDSIKIGSDQVLTLLWWRDEQQLLALSEDEEFP